LVTIDGETVEIERHAFDVLMLAIDLLVDTGDILAHAEISGALLARSKMASGSLRLLIRARDRRTAVSEQPREDPSNGPSAMEARARRLRDRARHPPTPAPASVIRALLPVLGASDSVMRPTLVPPKKTAIDAKLTRWRA
jgi:hypothetical protein